MTHLSIKLKYILQMYIIETKYTDIGKPKYLHLLEKLRKTKF